MKILALHGINLNMFGLRDSAHYGTASLADIDTALQRLATELGVTLECFQTNDEGKMCERIHQAVLDRSAGVLINAGAWSHTSLAIADALAILRCPLVEVHMSNIFAREAVRHQSYIAPLARGQICGLGIHSYLLGLRALVELAQEAQKEQDSDISII